MAKTNQPLLDELSDAQRNAVLEGADAIKTLTDYRRRTFDLWMTVARGVAPLCMIADRPGMSRKARKHLLKDNGYDTLNESTISRLKHMAAHETAIRAWRVGLVSDKKRDSWNSPTSICNRCPTVRKAIAAARGNKPPRKTKTKPPAGSSAADAALIEEQADEIRQLRERLTAAKSAGDFSASEGSVPPATELIGLRSENEELKEQLAKLKGVTEQSSPHLNTPVEPVTLEWQAEDRSGATAVLPGNKQCEIRLRMMFPSRKGSYFFRIVETVKENIKTIDEAKAIAEAYCGGAPTPKSKAKSEAKAAVATKPPLQWKEHRSPSDDKHSSYQAKLKTGAGYSINASMSFPSLKFIGYAVAYYLDGAPPEDWEKLATVKSAAKAKAIAEQHYRRLGT